MSDALWLVGAMQSWCWALLKMQLVAVMGYPFQQKSKMVSLCLTIYFQSPSFQNRLEHILEGSTGKGCVHQENKTK